MIIVDTFAWIEYFLGSNKGKIVEEYINEKELVTPSIVLIELSCKSAKENWNFNELLSFIKSKSNILGLKESVIVKCGKIYVRERNKKGKFGMNDATIWAVAESINAKILTDDEHFKDFKKTAN